MALHSTPPHDDGGDAVQVRLRDPAGEPAFDRLVRLAAAALQVPMAALVLFDEHGPWVRSVVGFAADAPVDALLDFPALRLGRTFELGDLLAAGPLRMNALVMGDTAARYYASQPVLVGGMALGALCIVDRVPRRLGEAERALLHDLAGLVAEQLRTRDRQRSTPLERRGAQDMARASGHWVWETDVAHQCSWLSDNFERERGRAPQDFLGRAVPDLEVLDTMGRPHQPPMRLRRLFEARAPFGRVVLKVESRRGAVRYVSVSGTPRFDPDHRFLGYRGTGRDITQRVSVEQRAQARAHILRKLADQVPGMLFQYERRADGRTTLPYASPGIAPLFELRARDLVKDAGRLMKRVHFEDRRLLEDSLDEAARAGQPWRGEFRVVLPKAGPRWLEGRAGAELRADGSAVWHGFFADVTERRQSQSALTAALARWELAAEVAGIGIVDVDFELREVRLDRRAARLHGLPDQRTSIAIDAWLATVGEAERHRLQLALRAVGRSRAGVVVRYRTQAAGGTLLVETALRLAAEDAPRDGVDASPRVIGTCHDATQRQRLEEAERDKVAAQEANDSKTRFLSRVSHELRTPLNAILGFGQLLEMDDSPARAEADREKIAAIRVAGQRLLSLINDMLDLARIEQGHLRLAPRDLDLHDVVHGALLLLRPLAGEREVTLVNRVPPQAARVYADERAIGQVLLNVLSNAVKYNVHGGEVAIDAEAGDAVVLRIADTGPGLTPQQTAALFQPFNRLGAEATATSGSGLGLVIARALMEAMHGELRLDSEPGVGTTVRLRLPPAERVALAHAPIAPGAAAAPLPPAAPRTVLYVEDDPVNVVLMQHLFAEEPLWTLRCAASGEEGLAAARQGGPDLVVIDMHLPDMSGGELRERLAREPRTAGIACVALSADAMAEQVDQALAGGFVEYWTKPVDVQAVHRRLRRLLAATSA